MRKAFFIGVILLTGCIFFAGCPRRYDGITIRQGVLLIGIDISYPPMEYFGPDGITPRGFTVEMAREISERLNLRPEFVNMSWIGIFDGLNANRYDVIISSVTVTPARQLVHNFSKPYFVNPLVMVRLRDGNITAQSPEELEGLDVGFQGGTTSEFFMANLAAETGMAFRPRGYDQIIRAFDDLRLGRLHTIITDLVVAYHYTAMPNSPFEIVWRHYEEPEFFAICLRKGNDELTYAINRVLEEMFDDGTMLRISYEILGMDLVTEARQTW
ncbi:MAG: ABC transporter substrate-binding protein [Treponema sp.]|nr:ABC transporter substrate-binding protein [Treponema sp.]